MNNYLEERLNPYETIQKYLMNFIKKMYQKNFKT